MENNKELLKQHLLNTALKFNSGIKSNKKPCHWILDCRELCLSPSGAYLVAALLYEKIKTYDCTQIGGVTLGADPIVSSMVLYSFLNKKPMSGFIIRKQAKQHGLRKIIEGDFKPGKPLILVDDIINSGKNLFHALDVLKAYNCDICAILSIVNFKRKGHQKLTQNKVKIEYLFDLKDLYIENRSTDGQKTQTRIRWKYKDINKWPVTIPRSTPLAYGDHLLFGTNEGEFLSVHKKNGALIWCNNLGVQNKKGVLSSPCNENEKVYFGAYNGYLYCIDANNGGEIWKTKKCDWIGSSPGLDESKVYVGIEFLNQESPRHAYPKVKNNSVCIGIGQKKEKGGLCAFSKSSGELKWQYETGHFIHSSPCVDVYRKTVIVGCNDGYIYAVDSQSGELRWKYKTGYPTRAGFAVDDDTGYVYFGSENGFLYCLTVDSGNLIWCRKIGTRIYNTPEVTKRYIITSTVSKRIFALDKSNGLVQWFYNTRGLIFGSTKTIEKKVYCGDNDGCFHVIDLDSGKFVKRFDLGNAILTTPVVDHGVAYLGCMGELVCVDLAG